MIRIDSAVDIARFVQIDENRLEALDGSWTAELAHGVEVVGIRAAAAVGWECFGFAAVGLPSAGSHAEPQSRFSFERHSLCQGSLRPSGLCCW